MSDDDEFKKVTNAYNAALGLWKLASEQIYSRFGAILTGNSIIIAVIGLTITQRILIPPVLFFILTCGGIVLCLVGLVFIIQGIRVENNYRQKVENFEKEAIPAQKVVAIRLNDRRYVGFSLASIITIAVFLVIYIVVLFIF